MLLSPPPSSLWVLVTHWRGYQECQFLNLAWFFSMLIATWLVIFTWCDLQLIITTLYICAIKLLGKQCQQM